MHSDTVSSYLIALLRFAGSSKAVEPTQSPSRSLAVHKVPDPLSGQPAAHRRLSSASAGRHGVPMLPLQSIGSSSPSQRTQDGSALKKLATSSSSKPSTLAAFLSRKLSNFIPAVGGGKAAEHQHHDALDLLTNAEEDCTATDTGSVPLSSDVRDFVDPSTCPKTADIDFAALRVVLVDDEPANQRVGLRFLKLLGVKPDHITVISDGAFHMISRV